MNEFCKKCSHYQGCAFISRNLQYKCDILTTFEEGYEYAIEKSCKWLEQNLLMEFGGVRDYIKNFRKAMIKEEK